MMKCVISVTLVVVSVLTTALFVLDSNFYNLAVSFPMNVKSQLALLAKYVCTYKEFVIVTEAPQFNRMTAIGQYTDNNRTIYKYKK